MMLMMMMSDDNNDNDGDDSNWCYAVVVYVAMTWPLGSLPHNDL